MYCDFFLEVNVVYIILVAACIGIIQFIWYQYRPFFSQANTEGNTETKNAYRRRNYDLYTIISEFRTDWAFLVSAVGTLQFR